MRTILLSVLCCVAISIHAQDTVKVASNLTPDQQAELDYNNGLTALHKNECATAVDLFTKAIAAKPTFDKAISNRAIAYTHLKKHTEAVIDINQAIKLNSQNPETYFNKGLIYFDMNIKDSANVALCNYLRLHLRYLLNSYQNKLSLY